MYVYECSINAIFGAYIYEAYITKALILQKLTYILGNVGENLHVGEAGHVQTKKHEICFICFARAPLLQHELLTIGIDVIL